MKKREILQELIEGLITDAQAEEFLNEILEDVDRTIHVHDLLGMSIYEWTAYVHGVGLHELASWRAHGWPNRCFVCGQLVHVENAGWLAREHDGRMHLRHVVCLNES